MQRRQLPMLFTPDLDIFLGFMIGFIEQGPRTGAEKFSHKKRPVPNKGRVNSCCHPISPIAPQVVDGVVPASQSAGGPWSTVALVPWTFNGAQPSQPSPIPDSIGMAIGLRLRGPFVLLLRVPAYTKPGSLCSAGRLLLPFTAFKHIRLYKSEYRTAKKILSSFRG